MQRKSLNGVLFFMQSIISYLQSCGDLLVKCDPAFYEIHAIICNNKCKQTSNINTDACHVTINS